LQPWKLALQADGRELLYTFDKHDEHGISSLLAKLGELAICYTDLDTRQSSLEDIFVNLVSTRK
jgi:hypothetical protein